MFYNNKIIGSKVPKNQNAINDYNINDDSPNTLNPLFFNNEDIQNLILGNRY